MRVDVIRASELDGSLARRWASLQAADPLLASPFFRPEFTQVVAEVRGDAQVAVIDEGDDPAGFFPFQRPAARRGQPIGGGRSNYQGVVAAPALSWDARALVAACGLTVWKFDHVLPAQHQFDRFIEIRDESPCMDLAGGFDAYAHRRGDEGSRVIKRLRQQERRIEREIGTLRFEPHVADPEILRVMMRWKSAQYLATGSADRFAVGWNVELLERIHAWQSPDFAGMLPTLYADDRVIAVAMCMRSRGTVHYWFPAYDQALARYSPGMLLLLRVAECAKELGIDLVDLGRGRSQYKDRLATGSIRVGEGAVVTRPGAAALRVARLGLARRARGSGLHRSARLVARRLRRS